MLFSRRQHWEIVDESRPAVKSDHHFTGLRGPDPNQTHGRPLRRSEGEAAWERAIAPPPLPEIHGMGGKFGRAVLAYARSSKPCYSAR